MSFLVNPYRFAGADILGMSPNAYWDISDASTLYQSGTRASPGTAATADGDPVGLVLDKSGNNIDFAQSTAGKRPLLKISGAIRYLLFDGSDDFLVTAAGSDPGHDWNSVHAFRVVSIVAGNQIHAHLNGNVTMFAVGGGTPGYGMFSNPSSGPQVAVSVGTDAIITEQWKNPGPCTLAVDKNTAVNSPSISQNFNDNNGIGIGATNAGVDPTNIRWYGGAWKRDPVFTDPQLATLQTYFGGLQGRSL